MQHGPMKPIQGLTILAGSLDNSTHVTDAGAPVDQAMLLAWTAGSVVAFLVFGVIRPTVLQEETTVLPDGHTPTIAPATDVAADPHARREERRFRFWIVRQMFSTAWAWLFVDIVSRILGYIVLPPTMLWRRHMLPLPQSSLIGSGEWLNKARLLFLCAPARQGGGMPTSAKDWAAYYLLGGFFRDVLELSSESGEVDSGLAEWAQVCQKHRQWRLPVSGMLSHTLSAAREVEHAKFRQYPNNAVRERESEVYHTVVVISVVICCMFVVSLFHFMVTRGRAMLRLFGLTTPASDTDLQDDEVADSAASAIATTGGRPPGQDADDSWLNSPEAYAEEARLNTEARRDARAKQHDAIHSHGSLSMSGMTLTIRECWPTLLGCVYAGMFAFVGGMPMMMRYLYPGMIALSSILAMFFSS